MCNVHYIPIIKSHTLLSIWSNHVWRQMMMGVEQSAEWLPRETEVFEENLHHCHFVHHQSHMTWPRLKPGPPHWEAND
jgi:hypothetical protein